MVLIAGIYNDLYYFTAKHVTYTGTSKSNFRIEQPDYLETLTMLESTVVVITENLPEVYSHHQLRQIYPAWVVVV